MVEKRYNVTQASGDTVQVCEWLNAFSDQGIAQTFCQVAGADRHEDLDDLHFAIVDCTIDAETPELASRLVARFHRDGRAFND